MDNYLVDSAVKAIHGDQYRALGPYEKLKDLQKRWSKKNNWRVAAAMTRADLIETDVGGFLEKVVHAAVGRPVGN